MSLNMFFSGSRIFSLLRIFGSGVVLGSFLFACGPRPPKVDHIVADFNLVPFYEDLFSIHPDSFENEKDRLINEYGSYLEAYSMRVIKSGSPYDDEFASRIGMFLSYEPNQEVLDTCKKVFGDLSGLSKELDLSFRYYRYYFPQAEIPDVYMHISGFNQSIVVDSTWVSVSVEKYLGSDCVFYDRLSIPVYLRQKMTPQKVVPDIMKALSMTHFLYNDSVGDLLSQMVYHGMIQYFMKQVLPYHSDEILLDYNKTELNWCRHYEKMMWSSIIERKQLFSTERLMIQKYIGEGPFSYYFGQESPGRTGIYLGYRIVQSFMKRNPEVTLADLMEMRDYHWLLSKAGYRP